MALDSNIDKFSDPIINLYNKDENGNIVAKLIENEPHEVVGGQFYLNQLPDKLSKTVTIPNMYQIKDYQEITNANQFKVDYNIGLVTVHPSLNGQTIHVTYYGTGIFYYPASRIWVKLDSNGNVITTFQDVVNKVNDIETSHVSNSDIHVSLDDKNKWNAKQDALGYTPENIANKGEAGGYAPLDNNKKLPAENLPSHASTSTTYGIGTTSNYGHVKIANNLTTSSYSDGVALSAYQGYLLKQSLDNKVDKVTGKGLSTNDFTDELKEKLMNIAEGATKVEKSNINGNIKINNIETQVYTSINDNIVEKVANKNQPNGYLGLNPDGKFDESMGMRYGAWVVPPSLTTIQITNLAPKNIFINSVTDIINYGSNSDVAEGTEFLIYNKTNSNIGVFSVQGAYPSWVVPAGNVLRMVRTQTGWEYTNIPTQLHNAFEKTANKGEAGGYAPLDNNKKLPAENLPSHASTSTTYGIGTTSNYGHVKIANNLTTSSHSDGVALSAYQGYLLDQKITNANNSLSNINSNLSKLYKGHISSYYDLNSATNTGIYTVAYDNEDPNYAYEGLLIVGDTHAGTSYPLPIVQTLLIFDSIRTRKGYKAQDGTVTWGDWNIVEIRPQKGQISDTSMTLDVNAPKWLISSGAGTTQTITLPSDVYVGWDINIVLNNGSDSMMDEAVTVVDNKGNFIAALKPSMRTISGYYVPCDYMTITYLGDNTAKRWSVRYGNSDYWGLPNRLVAGKTYSNEGQPFEITSSTNLTFELEPSSIFTGEIKLLFKLTDEASITITNSNIKWRSGIIPDLESGVTYILTAKTFGGSNPIWLVDIQGYAEVA